MYKCCACGHIFKTPCIDSWEEVREFWGSRCFETMYEEVCPNCGSEDFEKKDLSLLYEELEELEEGYRQAYDQAEREGMFSPIWEHLSDFNSEIRELQDEIKELECAV